MFYYSTTISLDEIVVPSEHFTPIVSFDTDIYLCINRQRNNELHVFLTSTVFPKNEHWLE